MNADAAALNLLPRAYASAVRLWLAAPWRMPLDDLKQEAALACLIACRGWDPVKGMPLERYVTCQVKHRLIDAIRTWCGRGQRRRIFSLDGRHAIACAPPVALDSLAEAHMAAGREPILDAYYLQDKFLADVGGGRKSTGQMRVHRALERERARAARA